MLTSMISGLSQDVTIYEISECNIDFWILQLKSSTLFEETEIYQRTAKSCLISLFIRGGSL